MISEIRISEDDSDIGIKCYVGSGYQDIKAMSGGEKVAIALAIRFVMAKLISSGSVDFVVLDEDRKKAFVELVEAMGQAVGQLIIITHDRNIFENQTVNAAFRFEKVAGVTQVTKS